MKLHINVFPLKLRHTFTISRGSQDVVETVIVSLEHEGIIGYGEASPNSYYNQSASTVVTALERAASFLENANPYHYRHILDDIFEKLDGNRTALCALDLERPASAHKRLPGPGASDRQLPPRKRFRYVGVLSSRHKDHYQQHTSQRKGTHRQRRRVLGFRRTVSYGRQNQTAVRVP